MDYTYIIYVLPAVILSMVAQFMVKSTFSAYNKIASKKELTGAQAASLLLRTAGITDVKITHISGSLTDNYNPGNKTLSLSESTYSSRSIAAVGVAAHETGHAIQHKVGYGPLVLRGSLVPAANIGSRFGPMMAMAGIVLGMAAQSAESFALWDMVAKIGIILFGAAVFFYLVTLPVEFNASHRALEILRDTGALDKEELSGARKVLAAAAMTYVASALTAIGNLVRLIVLSQNRRRKE